MTSDDRPEKKTIASKDETLPSRSRLDAELEDAGINITPDSPTIPTRPQDFPPVSRAKLSEEVARETDEHPITNPASSDMVKDVKAALANVPWTLQQFFNGDIDLDAELVKRFPSMPLMSAINFRSMGKKVKRGVATLSTQDRSAMVMIDANGENRSVQFSFTYGSMVTLRFHMDELTDMDRSRWLRLMRRQQGGLAFLWGQTRWRNDYIICIKRRFYTSLLAFSPNHFEAAARMTPDVAEKLLDWLEQFWQVPAEPRTKEPPDQLGW